MKKFLALLLALVMVLALCACGQSAAPAPAAPAAPAEQPKADAPAAPAEQPKEEAPAGSTDTYTFTYASTDPEGSEHDKRVEQVLKQLLEEKSDGRMTLDVYYSGSMGTVGSAMDAVKAGTVDMGFDACGFYGSKFPYTELYSVPCLNYGNSTEAALVLQEFDDLYVDTALNDFYIMARVCGDPMGFFTAGGKTIRTPDDLKGLTFRTTGANLPFVEACGGAGTGMPSGEIYEAMRLNVIDGTMSTIGSVVTFNLGEVTNAFTYLPIQATENVVVMNLDLYNSMNDFDKAIIDEVCAEWEQAFMEYNVYAEDHALEVIAQNFPDFEIIKLTDEEIAPFTALGEANLAAKAAELDAQGLDGTGAMEWLIAHAK